mmetsp:Transcript_73174/g.202959  ORF Transcript_73174/g.202959 Transcript_73174/m.202959 type:complete len:308 (-) Transcript_73174:521-1444(-)
MPSKRPDHVIHPSGKVLVAAGHEVLRPADHADWQPAAKRLPVTHDVSLHVVGPLGTAGVQPEARVHLVKDERHARVGADAPKLVQPLLVPRSRPHLPGVAGKHRVTRRGLVKVEALQRVDQHGRDLPTPDADDLERKGVHVLQAQDVLWQTLVARDRLHAVPPAVVGAPEGNDELPVRVETGNAHGRHHGLCARHVERYLVVSRDFPEHGDVVEDRVVQRSKEKALLLRLSPASFDEVLVLFVTAHVDAIGAADVHRLVSVQIHHVHAFSPIKRHGRIQILVHDGVEGWEAPARRETQIGNHLLEFR